MAETYEFDYFSSAQVSVFIGDVWIADLSSIQFTVNQQRMPIYGYASQYFHTLAPGRVMVEGQFSIAFKESAYLLETLRNNINKFGARPKTAIDKVAGRTPIEEYVKSGSNKVAGGNFLYYQLGALDDKAFEATAEAFTNVLWTKPEETYLTPNATDEKSPSDMIDYYRRADQYPPFNIYIVYGDYFTDDGSASMARNNTAKKIIDATIIGTGQSITFGGEGIHEVYNFVARNLV